MDTLIEDMLETLDKANRHSMSFATIETCRVKKLIDRLQAAESKLSQPVHVWPTVQYGALVEENQRLYAKLAELESREELVTNGQGEITTQPISEFLEKKSKPFEHRFRDSMIGDQDV
jgi:hypothetical protein